MGSTITNTHTQLCECDEVVCYGEQCAQLYRCYMLLLHVRLFFFGGGVCVCVCVGGGGGGKGKPSPVDTVGRLA